MIRNNKELVNNWNLRFEEISNNFYKAQLTDNFGRQAETTDQDLDKAIETCLLYAFDIEKQLNNTLNKFIYDTFKYFFADQELLTDNYSEKYFGSWIIEKEGKRLVLEGKDSMLSLQKLTEIKNWVDEYTINLKDLGFEQVQKIKYMFKSDL